MKRKGGRLFVAVAMAAACIPGAAASPALAGADQSGEPPAVAGKAAAGQPLRVFRIGPTGIMCVRPPCPFSGIMAETPLAGERSGWPVWWGEGDPPVVAAPALAEKVSRAWRAGGCLRVEGVWSQRGLAAHRILGACD